MLPVTDEATGWDGWSQNLADAARARHNRHETRLARERDAAEARAAARRAASASAPSAAPVAVPAAGATQPTGTLAAPVADDAEAKKRAIIQAALERARKKKDEMAAKGQGPLNTENVSADVQAQIEAAEARRRRLGLPGSDSTRDPEQPSNEPNPPPTAG
jgi:electron transport complex protein RnfB